MSDYDYDDPLFSDEELEEQLQRLIQEGDPEGGLETFDDYITQILLSNGLPEDYEIFVDLSAASKADIRGKVFPFIEDAINYLVGVGILGISKIVRMQDADGRPYFDVAIPENSDPQRLRLANENS